MLSTMIINCTAVCLWLVSFSPDMLKLLYRPMLNAHLLNLSALCLHSFFHYLYWPCMPWLHLHAVQQRHPAHAAAGVCDPLVQETPGQGLPLLLAQHPKHRGRVSREDSGRAQGGLRAGSGRGPAVARTC